MIRCQLWYLLINCLDLFNFNFYPVVTYAYRKCDNILSKWFTKFLNFKNKTFNFFLNKLVISNKLNVNFFRCLFLVGE